MQSLTKTDIEAIKIVLDLAQCESELSGIESFTESQKAQLWVSLTHKQRAKMQKLYTGLSPKQLAVVIASLEKVVFGWQLEDFNSLPSKHKKQLWDALDDWQKERLKSIKESWDNHSIDERDSIKAMRDLGYSQYD